MEGQELLFTKICRYNFIYLLKKQSDKNELRQSLDGFFLTVDELIEKANCQPLTKIGLKSS